MNPNCFIFVFSNSWTEFELFKTRFIFIFSCIWKSLSQVKCFILKFYLIFLVQQIERIIYTESNGVGALRKPLLVSFRGEEARDANTASSAGVRREFFMLLLQNLLNPDYGMIKEDEESNLSWFRDSDDNSEITLR